MGFWSSVTSFCSKVKDKVCEGVRYVKEKVKDGYEYMKDKAKKAKDKIKEVGTNMWNAFTGKKTAEEAKALYEGAISRYNSAKVEFDNFVEIKTKSINEKIEEINNHKVKIYGKYLKDYIDITSKLTNFNVISKAVLEKEFSLNYEEINIKSINSVMKIDFDNHKFKTSIQAIFTLGFYTRKKAKESLEEANKVSNQVDLEIYKMDAERKRIEILEESVGQVSEYFKGISEVMDGLLPKLHYSLSMLKNLHLVFSYSIIKGKLDFNKLPKAQMAYFEAAHTFNMILVDMSKKKYLKNNNVIQMDFTEAKQAFEKAMKTEYAVSA